MNRFVEVIQNYFKRKYKWKCPNCDDVLKSSEQPHCKVCEHIERIDMKMEKVVD